jgi:hypothetical protein
VTVEDRLRKIVPWNEMKMDLNVPKFAIGMRRLHNDFATDKEFYTYILKLSIALEMLLGETSSVYQRLYNAGLIDDSYGVEVTSIRRELFGAVLGDSPASVAVMDIIEGVLLDWRNSPDLTEAHFSMMVRAKIGEFLKRLNSLEAIVCALSDDNLDYFETVEILRSLTLEDVLLALESFVDYDSMSKMLVE